MLKRCIFKLFVLLESLQYLLVGCGECVRHHGARGRGEEQAAQHERLPDGRRCQVNNSYHEDMLSTKLLRFCNRYPNIELAYEVLEKESLESGKPVNIEVFFEIGKRVHLVCQVERKVND